MKKRLAAFVLMLLLPLLGKAESLELPPLVPQAAQTESSSRLLPLQSGPTVIFLPAGETVDLHSPYVVFGQEDSWTMIAQGSEEAFGPVGYVQTAALNLSDVPPLTLDPLPAMLEEDAPLTLSPQGAEAPFAQLRRGHALQLLFTWGEFIYVQCDLSSGPARGFIPLHTIL